MCVWHQCVGWCRCVSSHPVGDGFLHALLTVFDVSWACTPTKPHLSYRYTQRCMMDRCRSNTWANFQFSLPFFFIYTWTCVDFVGLFVYNPSIYVAHLFPYSLRNENSSLGERASEMCSLSQAWALSVQWPSATHSKRKWCNRGLVSSQLSLVWLEPQRNSERNNEPFSMASALTAAKAWQRKKGKSERENFYLFNSCMKTFLLLQPAKVFIAFS